MLVLHTTCRGVPWLLLVALVCTGVWQVAELITAFDGEMGLLLLAARYAIIAHVVHLVNRDYLASEWHVACAATRPHACSNMGTSRPLSCIVAASTSCTQKNAGSAATLGGALGHAKMPLC